MSSFMIMVLLLLLKFASSNSTPDGFIFNEDTLKLDGAAKLDSKGLLTLTNASFSQQTGHAFYNNAVQFKNSTNNGSVISFSTTFIFAIVPEYTGGSGMAVVISPSKKLQGALPGYLGLFDDTNIGTSSNHIVAVELDTFQDFDMEIRDKDSNHVGIDINGLKSIKSARAGYFPAGKNGNFTDLNLQSGDPMQVWVEYNGIDKQLNVTLSPINVPKPDIPLLS
ncbi:hypothetical protein ACSBR2_034288 [Camellia fascicularis]